MANWEVSEIFEPEESSDKREEQNTEPEKLSIKKWAEEDRPREKLMMHGAEALGTAELLAILIGGGSTKESAVELMRRLLNDCDNNLAILSKMSIDQLKQYNGIGEAKAISILAACELGKRREKTKMPERQTVESAKDVYNLLWPKMRDLDVEESWVLLMNHNGKVIKTVRLSHGGLTETAVDVRMVMKEVFAANATMVALAHNHPSGNIKPSRNDDSLTNNMHEACRIMRILFLDHVIITDGDYYSYRENGKI